MMISVRRSSDDGVGLPIDTLGETTWMRSLTTLPWLTLAACTSFGVADGDAADAGAAPPSDAASSDGASPDTSAAKCAGFSECDDFERQDPEAAFGWSNRPENASVARIERGPSLSPTRSLVVPLSGLAGVQGYLARPLAPGTRRLRLALGARVNPAIGLTQLFSLVVGNGRYVFVQALEGRLELVEQDVQSAPMLYRPVFAGRLEAESWSRYVLDVDLSAKRATLIRDGVEVATTTLVRDNDAIASVRVGVTYTAVGPRTTIHYDDVGILLGP